ncbi:MAG: ATP-dependent carboxylate-amine ligase [Salinigranum sp.]
MTTEGAPEILLLDGDYDNTLQIAKELSRDLGARIAGVGTARFSRLFFSRYCDESVILPEPGGAEYESALLSALRERRPDLVLPVGYDSTAALDSIRRRVPDEVALPLPPSDALEVAVDKRKTLALAADHGIDVPADYTEGAAGRDGRSSGSPDPEASSFPLFLKLRRETGETVSARVASPEEFPDAYDELDREAGGRELLVQECVDGDGRTYACGLCFVDGDPKLAFDHVELRSVPPRGGSGTRLRTHPDPDLEAFSTELLSDLGWNGVALVEYRRTADGYVLMEINPKFWASYALASQCGYRFASTLVAETLDIPGPTDAPPRAERGERVFPLREFAYCLRHFPDESLTDAALAMLWPPARPDVNVEDLLAWVIPPGAAGGASTRVRWALNALGRTSDPGRSETDLPRPPEGTRRRRDSPRGVRPRSDHPGGDHPQSEAPLDRGASRSEWASAAPEND